MKNLVASVVVFRELYNAKSNIYDVVGEFIKNAIVEENLESFTTKQLKAHLYEKYGFQFPPAVIYYTLRHIDKFNCYKGTYTLADKSWKAVHEDISIYYNKATKENEILESELLTFVKENAKKIKYKLSVSDEIIINEFCEYLLDEKSSALKDLFSLFVIENRHKYHEQFSLIKEGAILYEGLSYCHKFEDNGLWDDEMTVYLDTEVLFHSYGFNGELYQEIFDDFYSLIEEINISFVKRELDKRISLKYFQSSKIEIDSYFGAAKWIKEGKETLNPSKQAMVTIINGCEDVASIVEKQDDFYRFLDSKGITVDETDYHEDDLQIHNIESIEDVEALKKEFPKYINTIEKHLNRLSNINKIRKGKHEYSFEKATAVLVSGTAIVFEISKRFKKEREIPLSTSLEFMTNKLWLKLNKSFSDKKSLPKSFDLYTKAQMILSNSISVKLENSYDKNMKDLNNGNKTIEQFKSNYVAIRSSLMKPESVSEETSEEIISLITEEEFSYRKAEVEYLKGVVTETTNQKIILSEEVKELTDFKAKYHKLDTALSRIAKYIKLILKYKTTIIFNTIAVIIAIYILKKYSSDPTITGAATLFGTLYLFYIPVHKYISSEERS